MAQNDYDGFGDYDNAAYDCNGVEIKEGDTVIWTDPETRRKAKYMVFDVPNEEMVRLSNPYGECEAFPHECRVVPQ